MMYKELFYTSSETYMVERDVKLLHQAKTRCLAALTRSVCQEVGVEESVQSSIFMTC
jgi:hypothetical protein